jgi:hypothetical protein
MLPLFARLKYLSHGFCVIVDEVFCDCSKSFDVIKEITKRHHISNKIQVDPLVIEIHIRVELCGKEALKNSEIKLVLVGCIDNVPET